MVALISFYFWLSIVFWFDIATGSRMSIHIFQSKSFMLSRRLLNCPIAWSFISSVNLFVCVCYQVNFRNLKFWFCFIFIILWKHSIYHHFKFYPNFRVQRSIYEQKLQSLSLVTQFIRKERINNMQQIGKTIFKIRANVAKIRASLRTNWRVRWCVYDLFYHRTAKQPGWICRIFCITLQSPCVERIIFATSCELTKRSETKIRDQV